MRSMLLSVSDPGNPKTGERRLFGDAELIAAFSDRCSDCAIKDKQICHTTSCFRHIWLTPIDYVTHRLTK